MNTLTPVKEPKVNVISLKPLPNAGGLKAFADIEIGPLVIHGVRLIQASASQSPFCAPPQNEVVKDGEKKYFPVLTWPREWGYAITRAVYEAFSEFPEGIASVKEPRRGWPARPDGGGTAFRQEIRAKAGLDRGTGH